MTRCLLSCCAMLMLTLAACDAGIPEQKARPADVEPEPETVDIPQTVSALAPGTTPMRERVAVIGLLNKRNGIAREFELRPGQAVRSGDAIIRLRACETTAPWEVQQLTGAFVQLDVANPQDEFGRVFSGWLYKEAPSLNVVEHPIYDVWPKSCKMTHPGSEASEDDGERVASSRSSASKSGGSAPRPSEPIETAPTPEPAPPPATPDPSAADSNAM